ncbi:MFS transporter [Arthrobacter mobilis]|uniref:MFS transporter n=1 Tax=Arthrobacter mobilis TaxID=2724944 RepID=A0A7X6K7F3_9MICC|nr:MFS transporter [Arthrobacter mobilis]NKX56543.1 MFS transporter [Arthrobacter mobilis]
MAAPALTRRHTDAAWIAVVLAGITAAMHIWKLPAAIPVIQAELGMSLVQAGVLLGLVQVAGMAGGLAVSLFAELLGARRCLLNGLGLLFAGSVIGGFAPGAAVLMASRALEGAGFLMATVVAPGLIRANTPLRRVNTAVGFWSAYQGCATFTGLVASALVLQVAGWQTWWWIMAALTLVPVPLVLRFVPRDPSHDDAGLAAAARRIGVTVRSAKPWVAGVVFGCYTIQWMAVVGFLPTIYEHNGVAGIWPGILSAVVGGLNAVGAIATAPLLQRGVTARRLLIPTFMLMGTTSLLTFAVDWTQVPGGSGIQFACVAVFSLVGAVIPSTLTRMAVDLAPPGGSAPAAMGLMQQIFNAGNFTGPAIVAWLATATGGWHATWWMTCAFAALGVGLSLYLSEKRLGLSFGHR